MKTVTVFGSSKSKEGSKEYEQARELGKVLAREGFRVCNGGYKGIMAASARGAKEAGGQTLGITTSQFPGTVNEWIDEEKVYDFWPDRLLGLIENADAFVLCDGGTGTLTELFVTWEMLNHQIIEKPFVILGEFSRWLLDTLKNPPFESVRGIVKWSDFVLTATTPSEAIQILRPYLGVTGE